MHAFDLSNKSKNTYIQLNKKVVEVDIVSEGGGTIEKDLTILKEEGYALKLGTKQLFF